MRSDGRGASRVGRAREDGMQSVSRFTRLAIAASLILSAVFSVIAAIGFGGRASAGTGGAATSTAGGGSSTDVRLALPPKGSAGAPPVQIAPPISQPVNQAPPVVSGGS